MAGSEIDEMDTIQETFQSPTIESLGQGQTENPMMNSEQEILRNGYAGENTYLTNFSDNEIPGVPEQATSLREYSGGYAESTPRSSIRNVVNNVERSAGEGQDFDISPRMLMRSKSGQKIQNFEESGYIEGPEGKSFIYSNPAEVERSKMEQSGKAGPQVATGTDGQRDKFMEHAIKQIGFNPFTFNPNEEAQKDIDANYNSIVAHVFGNNTNPRYLTKEQNQFLQQQIKMYYDLKVGVYSKKGELGKFYLDHMLTNFDKEKPTIHGRYVVDKDGKLIRTLPALSTSEEKRKEQSEELGVMKKIEDLVGRELKSKYEGKVNYDPLTQEWKFEPGSDRRKIRDEYLGLKKKYYDHYKIPYDPKDFQNKNPAGYEPGEAGNVADAVKYLDAAKDENDARQRMARLAKATWKKEDLKRAIWRSKWR